MEDADHQLLTDVEAYHCMIRYLQRMWDEGLRDLGVVLGELPLIAPGKSADSAAWPAWLGCVSAVLQERKPR